MNIRTLSGRSAVALTVAALLTASSAAAQLPAVATDCRATIAKSFAKVVKTASKTIAGCHKSRNKGEETLAAVDCNDMTAADAAKLKFQGAVAKHVATVTGACADPSLAGLLTAANVGGDTEYYVSCPVTCAGVASPIVTMADVAECQGCVAAAEAGAAAATALGMPPLPMPSVEQKCHSAIAKGYAKYLDTALKAENACQGDNDELGINTLTACVDADPSLKVAGALTKAGDGVTKSCTDAGANIALLDGCAGDNFNNLKACSAAAYAAAENADFTATYEMEAAICPTTVRTTIRGACSVNGSVAGNCSSGFQTGTELSVGWKGMAHGVDITDSYTLAGDVTCPGTFGACGDCTVDNISVDNPQYADFTRCKDDTAVLCDEPFDFDTQCPGTQECNYFLGPPLAVSAGGTPTCTLNIVSENITGTANPDAGTSELLVVLRSKVHNGVSQSRPCPICRNDETPQDGVRAGTCLGGAHDGDPCDVQGFDLSFAPTDPVNPTAGSSLDCPPNSAANISGQGLAIDLPLTTGQSTKDAVDPCESPNAALSCFCGVCSVDTAVSCNTDLDCSSQALGVCGAGNPPGVDRKPNNCTDGVCTDIGATDRGQCLADTDSFCEGLLFANGHGILSCNENADCDAYNSLSENEDDWVCQDNNCGTCSILSNRSCFLDPIVTEGTPDQVNPILVGTFCLPPSSNGSVNSATGSPGPSVVKTDALIELRY